MNHLLTTVRPIMMVLAVIALAAPVMAQPAKPQGARQIRRSVKPIDETKLPARIAFGSCAKQTKPQPVLRTIVGKRPDVFVYLGDNIYGDTRDMKVLQAKYDQLGAKPEFQSLRKEVMVLSVWDDHDYGENDAGKEYPKKAESREIFFDFWRVPEDSPRRKRPGIYGAHRFRANGRTLQIILLDTRTFRDPLKRLTAEGKVRGYKNDYEPDSDPDKTILGAAQWKWLEQRLAEPADVRVICSSIQFGHAYNGWESWTNMPRQQQKMISLIRKTKANGVVFVSGDVHWGEISKRDVAEGYPLFDVTASGITEEWYNVEPNRYRLDEAVRDNHFGMIEIDWAAADPVVSLRIIDRSGKVRLRRDTPLSGLQFPQ